MGNSEAVASVCTQRAERMGAARMASSADCSHGCGSHAVIATQALDTPSPTDFF